ncbi:MAG: acyl carrier protein [Gammaproteobacteria bacterium]|jgi:acyl carrier protein
MSVVVQSQTIESRVLCVVKEVLGLDDEPRDLDLSITQGLALDSLDQLSLFMALEDEFGGRIHEEDAERIVTLRDVVNHIREQMSAASSG